MGYDVFKEPIPVVPAQHYFMGGVKVNHHSRTSMESLYAVGETACNGVHGRNRLASNSLLESLVFAKRAAGQMAELGFVNDEIAAKRPQIASTSQTTAMKSCRERIQEASHGGYRGPHQRRYRRDYRIRHCLYSGIESVFQPRCEWTAKSWPYERHQNIGRIQSMPSRGNFKCGNSCSNQVSHS